MTTPTQPHDSTELAAYVEEAREIGGFNGWGDADLMARYGAPLTAPQGPDTTPGRYRGHPEVAAAYADAYREQFAAYLDDRTKY
jgi:hypothetical protein